MHADDISPFEEVSHVVRGVGVNAAVPRYRRVSSGQADSASLRLVLELVHFSELETSSYNALCTAGRPAKEVDG